VLKIRRGWQRRRRSGRYWNWKEKLNRGGGRKRSFRKNS